ncbi:MAG TPA: NAD(P)H-dependent oxidoreductase [Streptosporangiaceae bacterium]|nr:NAD(P)H-dependent oxidoreductase [Streptosporangiaceae bacterium]
MPKPTLQIIIASTRPGRVGPSVAAWINERAVSHGAFDVELIDLAEVSLPMFDEPKHPRFGEYVHEHTRAWSATIARGDAFILVLPEYNYGLNAAIKNAIDYLNAEWRYKPVGFASYGGVAAGTRSVQMLKQVSTVLKMVPLSEVVHIPFVHQIPRQRAPPSAERGHGAGRDRDARRAGQVDGGAAAAAGTGRLDRPRHARDVAAFGGRRE